MKMMLPSRCLWTAPYHCRQHSQVRCYVPMHDFAERDLLCMRFQRRQCCTRLSIRACE